MSTISFEAAPPEHQELQLNTQRHRFAGISSDASPDEALLHLAFHGDHRTYLLVDGTLRKNVTGLFDLDVVDVPTTCLFKGELSTDVEEAAPYLVDLTLPEDQSVAGQTAPAFHRDYFEKHWGRSTGVLVRTTASHDELRDHFRKFTKVQCENEDGWQFFRFWDPRIAAQYFSIIATWPERISKWFTTSGGHQLTLLIEQDNGKGVLEVSPNKRIPASNRAVGPLTLSSYEMDVFRTDQTRRDINKISGLLRKTFPTELNHLSDSLLTREISHAVSVARQAGFLRFENLFLISAWAAFFGRHWLNNQTSAILHSDHAEDERIKALKQAMSKKETQDGP